ncbi:MAG: class I SAM-dependent methyltransferase, partial [Thaumarchaeota archaeon]|nr:class I SAM-dependent methyltransferase [Nitrososphaerota archaeon]
MKKINPLQLFLWTFRRNEKDVVNLYNALSDVMRLATTGDMLNFGYWNEEIKNPIDAQIKLCKIFGRLAELETAKKIVDVGSGFSAPAIQWKSQFSSLEIACLNINFDQLKQSSQIIKKILGNTNHDSLYGIYLINATSNSLPFADESFDRILVLESAQHIKPFDIFIAESNRILKNNGILVLSVPVVNGRIATKIKLGILAMTWPSEHYTFDFIKSSITDCGLRILEIQKIGSNVYGPLVNYYIENRDSLKKRILSKYPSYVEKVLFKSLLKMKQVSETNVIDYILI